MDKKALWDKFIRTGKISDYLRYRKAERNDDDYEFADFDVSDEFYLECPNGEDCDYDDENEWYSDS